MNNFVAEVKRKKNESFEAFFRRVKQQWMKSGKILQAKKIQFYTSKPSKGVQKKQSVTKAHKTSKKLYLQKVGKLPLDDPRKRRRRRR